MLDPKYVGSSAFSKAFMRYNASGCDNLDAVDAEMIHDETRRAS